MRLIQSPTILGTAAVLAARIATAQAPAYEVRVEPPQAQQVYVYIQESQDTQDEQGVRTTVKAPQRMQVKGIYTPASDAAVGVDVSPVPPAMAAQLRLRSRGGAVVEAVIPGSPAEQAGIQQYDVIEQVDGKDVGSPEQLRQIISGRKPGESVSFGIVREGKRRTVEVAVRSGGIGGQEKRLTPPVRPTPFRVMPPNVRSFQFSPADKQKLDQMSDKLHRNLQDQERQIEAMAEKLKAQMEDMRQQIRQLRDQIKEEAKDQKKQMLDKVKEKIDKLEDEDGKKDKQRF